MKNHYPKIIGHTIKGLRCIISEIDPPTFSFEQIFEITDFTMVIILDIFLLLKHGVLCCYFIQQSSVTLCYMTFPQQS
jgi:hypothetical protein